MFSYNSIILNFFIFIFIFLKSIKVLKVFIGSEIFKKGISFTIEEKDIINHPYFKPLTKTNDISLIRVPDIVYSGKFLQKIFP